jgi:hypothetical protein
MAAAPLERVSRRLDCLPAVRSAVSRAAGLPALWLPALWLPALWVPALAYFAAAPGLR